MEAIDQIFVNAKSFIVSTLESLGLPDWLTLLIGMVLPATLVVIVFPATFAFLTWLERKILGRIQNRYGPNRTGPWGILQPVADGLKMLIKEDIVPRAADKLLHGLAPILVVVPAVVVFAFLPFGRNMVPADTDVALLFFFAVSSISTLALFMAGWGSRNKYSRLGAMRSIAQMISYELPLLLAAVPVVMIVGSLRLTEVVSAQATEGFFGSFTNWFVFTPWGFVGFLAFFVAGMAETNRSPFDLAEGESEIIAGFHTEYSGFKFALFFLAEYLSAIAMSGLAAVLFLGGWNGPEVLPSWLWFFGKIMVLLTIMIWIRGTFPRLRVDQLMGFSWKFLLPLSLVNIFATGVWFWTRASIPGFAGKAAAFGIAAVVLLVTYVFLARINAGPAVQKRTYRYADL